MNINLVVEVWDVTVVGGGPAGSAAAISAAKMGLQVLQVDAKAFPRRKVCGGCLNQVSIRLLQQLVDNDSAIWNQAAPLNQFRLMDRQRQFDFPTPAGLVIDRSRLDAELVETGQRHGVTFLAPVTAALGDADSSFRSVELRVGSVTKTIRSRVVILATGLGSLRGVPEQLQQTTHPTSRVGVEGLVRTSTSNIDQGLIQMAVGRHGYVGMTKLSDQQMHLAAAVDRAVLREIGPLMSVQRILDEAGADQLLNCPIEWRGTPALTARAKRLGASRAFLVGDAANYVEPFTGEGILWALKSGIGVAALLPSAIENWDDSLIEKWEAWHRANIQSQQKLCQQISFGLKHPSLRWLAHQLLRLQPKIAHHVIHRLNT